MVVQNLKHLTQNFANTSILYYFKLVSDMSNIKNSSSIPYQKNRSDKNNFGI